jgi:hypothetical protein
VNIFARLQRVERFNFSTQKSAKTLMESTVFNFLMSQKFHRRWSKKEQGVLPASLLQTTVTQGLTKVSKGASSMRVSLSQDL